MIDILLATYQSERFLEAQIRSLQAQTRRDWRLLVHDGGSSDGTVSLIERLAAEDVRIRFLGSHRMGAAENFAYLWRAAEADYRCFCDHDDVWLPEKLAREMAAMAEAEAVAPGLPVVVFCDATVVDEALQELGPSSWRWQGLDPRRVALRQLLLQNVAAGNTQVVNRAFAERCPEIPPEAVMHDHWVMLVGALFGRLVRVDEPLLRYRQHGRNVLGASAFSAKTYLAKAREGWGAVRRKLYRHFEQAAALLRCYGPAVSPEARRVLEAAAQMAQCGPLRRRWRLLRYGILKAGVLRNLGLLLVV